MARLILVLNDDRDTGPRLARVLEQAGYETAWPDSAQRAVEECVKRASDLCLVIVDLRSGIEEAVRALQGIKRAAPLLPVIALSTRDSLQAKIEILRHGADGLLEEETLSGQGVELALVKVHRLTRDWGEGRFLQQAAQLHAEFFARKYQVVGRSPSLRRVVEQARGLAALRRPILIQGERGTGKELIAATIHSFDSRTRGPFVPINCPVISDEVMESALFGHEPGALAGARTSARGGFEMADRGTLFLDEVANLSLPVQQRLLDALQRGECKRVGGAAPMRFHVRLLAATGADLARMVQQDAFLPKLHEHLASAALHVPPLRERRQDIDPLIDHFAKRIAFEAPWLRPKRFTEPARKILRSRTWPGNVRELRSLVECLAYAVEEDLIDAHHIPPPNRADLAAGPFHEQVQGLQRLLIETALAEARYNQQAAAENLGLRYDQFRHYYRKFRLGGQGLASRRS